MASSSPTSWKRSSAAMSLLQEVQRRPLEPGNKVERRQQYCRPPSLAAAQRGFIDVLDLPVRKPVEIVEEE